MVYLQLSNANSKIPSISVEYIAAMAAEWQSTYDLIKATHDEAYRTIEKAIKCEELEQPNQALTEYKNGIAVIDRALKIPVELPDSPDDTWQLACDMIHKMKRTRGEVLQRVGSLASKYPDLSEPLEVPSSAAGSATRPRTYTELTTTLEEMANGKTGGAELELLFSCDGVKLYHIQSTGTVTSSQTDSTLRIVRFEKDEKQNLDATVFLQVIKTNLSTRIAQAEQPLTDEQQAVTQREAGGNISWIYPLVPGVSICFRTDYGAFILPDLVSNSSAAIGLLVPSGADEIVMEIFIDLLHGVIQQGDVMQFGAPPSKPAKTYSDAVSENLVRGAYYISGGLVKGAEKTGELITYSTPYLITKLAKAPADAPPMSNKMQTTISVAKAVTGTAATVTGWAAQKVGSATMCIGRFLAPHIQKQGSKLLSHSFGMSEEQAMEKMSGVLTICAGAVEGFGTVYSGLEESATILGRNLSANTVKVVGHKYGESSALFAGQTFDTVGNVINVSNNLNYITPKGLAKRTAKNAGKALVEDYKPRLNTVDEGNTLYPDLSGLEKEIGKAPTSTSQILH